MENENMNNNINNEVNAPVTNIVPEQPVLNNNVVKEKNEESNNNRKKDSYCIPYVNSYCYFINYCILCMVH